MKKLLLLPILLLTSCHQTSLPFKFNDKYYTSENKGLKDIEFNDFYKLEKDKESFGIYVYLPGCLTCNNFKPILEEFLNQNNIQLYSISYTKIKNTSCILEKKIEYTPSIALFYQGEIEAYLDTLSDEHIEYYESVEGLTSWFKTYIDLESTSN